MIETIPPKGVSFSNFICTFAAPCYAIRLFANRNYKIIEKLPPTAGSLSTSICTFAAPCYEFRLFPNCDPKIREKSDTAKS